MKKFLILIALFSSLLYFQISREIHVNNCLNATCQVTIVRTEMVNGMLNILTLSGTGTVFYEDEVNYYVLTAGHVLNNSGGIAAVAFFPEAGKMEFGIGTVEFHKTVKDLEEHEEVGIVAVSKKSIKRKITPIALSDREDKYVFTIGCSNGEHPSMIKSYVYCRNENTGLFYVNFMPKEGRSGSAVFSSDGVSGIVTRSNGECVSSEVINRLIKDWMNKQEAKKKSFWENINCEWAMLY